MNGKTGISLENKQLSKHPKYIERQQQSYGNEIGRLAQGMPGKDQQTNTIFFIKKSKLPKADTEMSHMDASSVIIERAKPNQINHD